MLKAFVFLFIISFTLYADVNSSKSGLKDDFEFIKSELEQLKSSQEYSEVLAKLKEIEQRVKQLESKLDNGSEDSNILKEDFKKYEKLIGLWIEKHKDKIDTVKEDGKVMLEQIKSDATYLIGEYKKRLKEELER